MSLGGPHAAAMIEGEDSYLLPWHDPCRLDDFDILDICACDDEELIWLGDVVPQEARFSHFDCIRATVWSLQKCQLSR